MKSPFSYSAAHLLRDACKSFWGALDSCTPGARKSLYQRKQFYAIFRTPEAIFSFRDFLNGDCFIWLTFRYNLKKLEEVARFSPPNRVTAYRKTHQAVTFWIDSVKNEGFS